MDIFIYQIVRNNSKFTYLLNTPGLAAFNISEPIVLTFVVTPKGCWLLSPHMSVDLVSVWLWTQKPQSFPPFY